MGHRVTIDHLVWDWNGTLFADGRALIESTIEAFSTAGMPQITRQLYQHHHAQPIHEFYDRLAGRVLTEREQAVLAEQFQAAYLKRRDTISLTSDAVEALTLWTDTGRTQSLLSMYPHERLLPLVEKTGIRDYFTMVDGLVGDESHRKAPHLERQLDKLSLAPDRVLLIGDSADDALAARACGVRCLLYHAGEHALHSRDHFSSLDALVVEGLREAVELVLGMERQVGQLIE